MIRDVRVVYQLGEIHVAFSVVGIYNSVRSGLCGCGGLLCCFSVSAMAQWCGATLVTDDSRLFTLSVDLRL